MEGVDNVAIFVSDSLRWDFLPSDMSERGITFKTVAQSTYSPPSFTTLSTGLYPHQHGVNGFDKKLADGVETTYDIPGVDGSYFNTGRMVVDALYRTYDIHEQKSLAELEPPFWYLERDTTTHAPFMKNSFFHGENVNTYFAEKMPYWDSIRDDYRTVIRESIELFDRRIKVLERIAERENTLIIFTSDHGELFGDHNDILHISPMCPELVYVPTVFIHPSLDSESFHADPETDVIEHTDVIQTCLSAIGKGDAIQTEGVNLLSEPRPTDYCYSHTTTGKAGVIGYQANGIWWFDGGYTKVENPKLTRLSYLTYKLMLGSARSARWRMLPNVVKTYWKDNWEFGSIPISTNQATELLEGLSDKVTESDHQKLDSEAKSRLRNLGYQ